MIWPGGEDKATTGALACVRRSGRRTVVDQKKKKATMMTRKLILVYLYNMATAGTIKWILPCIGHLGIEHLGKILALPTQYVLLRYHGSRQHRVTHSLTARSANQSINQSINNHATSGACFLVAIL
jgi:hypothetical protein